MSKEDFLVEMTVYDPSISGTKVLYFTREGFTSRPSDSPANQHYMPCIKDPGNFQANMFQEGRTFGASKVEFGEVRLNNSEGSLDDLLNYGFDGRDIVFRWVTALGAIVLLASCSMEQPEFTTDEITVRIKDPQMLLNVPIQPTKYAGTNVLPNGIEGAADIQGKPKPLVFGEVFNITPVLVNSSKLIYQVNPALVQIPAVYDKAVPLLRGDDYTSQSDMEATAPAPGTFRVWPAGGCFRLGSKAIGQITCDAIEGATAADRTAAQIGKRIALRVLSSDQITDSDITALDGANSAEIGIYIAEETTVLAVLDQVFGSIGAWYGFGIDRKLRMQQFVAPSGEADVTLAEAEIENLERVASSDTGRGIPAWRVNLNYGKNYTVQTDLAGSVQSVRESTHWQGSTFPSSAAWIDVEYGNGIYVAIGLVESPFNATAVFISIDGKTWEQTYVTAVNTFWGGVAYGNGLFIAPVSNTNTVMTSPDGIVWTQRTLPATANWQLPVFGGGVFVVPGYGSDKAVISSNGVDWTLQTLPSISNWGASAYGSGLFVLVEYGTNVTATSPDGVTWTGRTVTAPGNWLSCAYGNGIFALVAFGSATILTSPNGIDWTQGTLPATANWSRIQAGGGYFMLIGSGANSYISPDASTWTAKSTAESLQYGLMTYGDGRFVVAVMQTDHGYSYIINPSSERANWLGKEYRTVSVSDPTIKTMHLLAPELNVETLLIDPDDASAEAARLLNLYKVRRDTNKVTVSTSVLRYIELGKKVKIIKNRFGYNAGKLFRVIGVLPDWEAETVTLTVWG